MTPELLEATGLEASYGAVVALRGVSVRVAAGELVALIGANGAGKSTLLNVLSGLVPARRGQVRFDGQDITRKRAEQRVGLGLVQVPEGREILRRLTVEENLRLGAYRRTDNPGVRADLQAIYARFPVLAERRQLSAGALSGGEQQMLAVGRALMARPRLLLLDEPSLGLAPMLVQQVFDLVRQLRDEGQTVLLVEQNARQALQVSDRAYLLQSGSLVLEGPSKELAADQRVQQAYLGRATAADPPAAERAR
jgi:branched-chain amino acid transport system ATP-binding protein